MQKDWFNDRDIMLRIKEEMSLLVWQKLNKLKRLYDVATAMYGAEYTDLSFGYNNDWEYTRIHLIIHYPYITIRNECGESHEIYNLYITVDMQLNVKGFRTTLSVAECQSGYCHSHISSVIGGDFCKGHSPLALAVADYQKVDKITTDDARRFIFALDVFLPHESIEGKPYKYMKSISENTNSNFVVIPCYIQEKHLKLDFNYSINDNWIVVLNDYKLEPLWKDADFVAEVFNKSLTTLTLNGKNISETLIDRNMIYFKEERIKLTITDVATDYILPLFYQKIFIKQFEKKINEYIINASRQTATVNA